MSVTIAVLLATYNRKEKTIVCLKSLKEQVIDSRVLIDLYVTDDLSIDGTPEAIKEVFPDADIYNGTGKLFWAGGMRASWLRAIKKNHDFYLLLNDDTILLPAVIQRMLDYYKKDPANSALLIGTTKDAKGISYGGKILTSKLFFRNNKIAYSETDYTNCDLGNANIMWVPKNIVNKIGILSGEYTHSLADYDYTLTAKKAGFKVLVAPGIYGLCTDEHGKNWKSKESSLKERIEYLKSPKGLAYNEYLLFIRKHLPIHYPIAYIKLWGKTLFPQLWDLFKK